MRTSVLAACLLVPTLLLASASADPIEVGPASVDPDTPSLTLHEPRTGIRVHAEPGSVRYTDAVDDLELTWSTSYVQLENHRTGERLIVLASCAPASPPTGHTCTVLQGDETGFTFVAAGAGCAPPSVAPGSAECPYVVVNANGQAERVSATLTTTTECAFLTPAEPTDASPAPGVCVDASGDATCSERAVVGLHEARSGATPASATARACNEWRDAPDRAPCALQVAAGGHVACVVASEKPGLTNVGLQAGADVDGTGHHQHLP